MNVLPVWIIKKMIVKLAEKGVKINPVDVFDQTNADDIIQIVKELIF